MREFGDDDKTGRTNKDRGRRLIGSASWSIGNASPGWDLLWEKLLLEIEQGFEASADQSEKRSAEKPNN